MVTIWAVSTQINGKECSSDMLILNYLRIFQPTVIIIIIIIIIIIYTASENYKLIKGHVSE